MADNAESRHPATGGVEQPGSRGWIGSMLYIEDNPANLVLVQRILRREPGVEVLSATQGQAGLQMARDHRPRMILLDAHLPDLQATDVLRELKLDPMTAAIPVVILTADATETQRHRLLSKGAVAYLTKPFEIPEFERVIGAYLHPDDEVLSIFARSE